MEEPETPTGGVAAPAAAVPPASEGQAQPASPRIAAPRAPAAATVVSSAAVTSRTGVQEEREDEEEEEQPAAPLPQATPQPTRAATQQPAPAAAAAPQTAPAAAAAQPAAAAPAPPAAPLPPPGPRRIAVITGGTGGIGLALARELLRRDAWDVVVGASERHPDAAKAAVAALLGAFPAANTPGGPRLVALPLDLAKPTSVEDFASKVVELCPRVHWLFLNAAIGDVAASMLPTAPKLTADGHEETVAVNYLGHYALTLRLMPALSAAFPSRVVSVSCGRHTHAWRLDWENWQLLKPGTWFKAGDAYNNSKVLNILFAFKFNRR
jgi:NAD(P)-dependent dehydrogenase (short-subunit alcohol dehydrogenase family)